MIILWSLIVGLICPVPQPSTDFRRLAEKDLHASVLIHIQGIKDGKRVMGGCSGTYISPDEIITAAHCFQGYEPHRVWVRGTNDPIGYQVALVRLDPVRDLALLKAPLRHSYCKLGAMPHIGDPVMNIGSPLIFEFAVSEGIVSATRFHFPRGSQEFIVTTAMINHGSSGGGAFNEKGQLIGVNTQMVGLYDGWQGISLAVTVNNIRGFINER